MKANRQILLYGNSVILGSIGASLRPCSQFEVTSLTIPRQDPQAFNTVKPDIVIFDLEFPHAEAPFYLLKNHPGLVLIGISPDTNLVRVWNSRQQQEMSMQDLFELIKSEASGSNNLHDAPTVSRQIGSNHESNMLA